MCGRNVDLSEVISSRFGSKSRLHLETTWHTIWMSCARSVLLETLSRLKLRPFGWNIYHTGMTCRARVLGQGHKRSNTHIMCEDFLFTLYVLDRVFQKQVKILLKHQYDLNFANKFWEDDEMYVLSINPCGYSHISLLEVFIHCDNGRSLSIASFGRPLPRCQPSSFHIF